MILYATNRDESYKILNHDIFLVEDYREIIFNMVLEDRIFPISVASSMMIFLFKKFSKFREYGNSNFSGLLHQPSMEISRNF